MRLFGLAALAFVATACAEPTAPLRPLEATIEARYLGLEGAGNDILDPISVSVLDGQLTVTGPFSTPNTCATFSVSVNANARIARVRVIAGPDAGPCFPAFALYEYDVVAQLTSAPERVIVEHAALGGSSTRIYEVSIPH